MSCPEVSGVSPKEGVPGTKVTIRGQNLGNSKEDIESITICGKDCTSSLEYVNSKKLICLTPNVWGTGDIIVTTTSGGRGKCTVTFAGLEPEPVATIGPMQESDVWIDEDFDSLTWKLSEKNTSPVYTRDLTHPLGANVVSSRKARGGSDNLGDFYPEHSGNLLDEKFHPVRHLLEKHRHTNFQDLKTGLRNLQMELDFSNQAPVHFMLDNLDAFLQGYDTLSDVNELLIRNESESHGGSLTERVEELLRDSAHQAQEIFDGILKSKIRADTTRNALTVLQRYRFLFGLPKNIERNIRHHDYDPVATDYERAKSLFCNTQVKVFKKVFDQVEKQIAMFRLELRQQLLVLPSTLDEQKKLIKYLLEVDCEGDPAWDCISNMCLWILRLLFTSKEDFQETQGERMPGELASLPPDLAPPAEVAPSLPPRSRSVTGRDGHSRSISDVSFASTSSYGSQTTYSSITTASNPTSTPVHQALALSGAGDMPTLKGPSKGVCRGAGKDSSGPPDRIMFVEDVTEIFRVTLPGLWTLGQAYLKGSLFQGVALLTENQKKLSQKCEMNRNKFETKVMDIIEIYTNMVNSALFVDAYQELSDSMKERLGVWKKFDDDIHETSGVWLSRIVRSVRECVSKLEGVGLPENGMAMLHHLAMNVRSLCADTLFQCAAKDVKLLHEREDWKVHDEDGGLVTSLPVLFENRVVEVLLTLKEIVNEPQEYSQVQINQELRDTARDHFAALLEHFMACIDYLAFHSHEDDAQSPTNAQEELEQPPTSKEEIDEHLLILMSNMDYTSIEVIPRLTACFMNHGYPSCMDIQDQVLREMYALDKKIFELYVSHKSECFSGIIEHGMDVGYFDWDQAMEPTKVRSYIRDILMNLVLVHAEVYAVSPQLVPRVMHELVKIMSKEFYDCIAAVEAFNVNGIIYAFIELAALEDLLKPYIDAMSRKNFDLSRKHLGEWDVAGCDRVTVIVEEFKKMTRFQLKCFTDPDEGEDPAVEMALPTTD